MEAAIVEDPAFFAEVVSAVYRPHNQDDEEEYGEGEGGGDPEVANNAYRLLSSCRRVPGLDPETNEIDADVLSTFVTEARRLLGEADRLEVGETEIGRLLSSAPGGDDGIVVPPAVRDLLEELQSERVERGLDTAIRNSRGVTSRDPEAGGEMERELAAKYESAARETRTRWPRTAAIMRGLAASFLAEARRHDEDAERLRKGLER